jgi:hypothetical protein
MREYRKFILTDKETGEVIDAATLEIKAGSRVGINATTEAQRDAYKHKQELDKEMAEFIKENEGAYSHLIYKYGTTIFRELEEKVPESKSNTHVIRFIVLASHITFGGKLFDSNKNRIKKSSLKNIWGTTSKNSINETYNLLMECGYIYETEEGYLMINEDMVIKGEIAECIKELKKQDGRYTCTRIFMKNIQDMFDNTEPRQRKILANLFKVLPYINFKYNVFCENPTETDETKLELLNWTDLARICGYDETKVTRFKKDLMNLKVYGYDVIGEFNRSTGKTIVVNPKVYYGGDDTKDVEWLYRLFNMNPKK